MNQHISNAIDPAWSDPDASVAFLKTLRPKGPWNLSAISPEKSGAESATFTDPDRARAWLTERSGRANLYYVPNPAPRPTGRAGRANKADVAAVQFHHVDIDEADGVPLAGDPARKAQVLAKLRAMTDPGPPTVIADSGGGLQALWRLDGDLRTERDKADAERVNEQLIATLGGDPGTWDIGHLLRLPGTVNLPDARKRSRGRVPVPATLIEASDRSYLDIDFTAAPPRADQADVDIEFDAPSYTDDLDTLGLSERLTTIVRDGRLPEPKEGDDSRSAWLFDAVCGLVRAKVPDETILGLLLDSRWEISASVLDHAEHDQLRYAEHQVRRAHGRIRAELAEEFADEVEVIERPPSSAPGFETTYAESLAWREPKWLIDGIIPFGGLVQNYGARKSLKTFVSIDMALCIATGREYHGLAVQRGKVTYVAAEGSRARFRDRLTAWCRLNKVDPTELDGWLYMVNRPVNLTDKREVDAFIKGLRDGQERHLIVFDTLSKNTGGVDEDTKGMKLAVNGANNVRFATGAAVLLIHHEGKDATKKGRGSTVLPGDVDMSLRTQRLGNGRCTVSVDEARDIDEGKTFAFELQRVVVGELDEVSAAVRLLDEQVGEPKTTDDKVLVDIVEHGKYDSTKELVDDEVEGRSKANVYKVVARLREAGLVKPDDPPRATRKGMERAMLMGAAVPNVDDEED